MDTKDLQVNRTATERELSERLAQIRRLVNRPHLKGLSEAAQAIASGIRKEPRPQNCLIAERAIDGLRAAGAGFLAGDVRSALNACKLVDDSLSGKKEHNSRQDTGRDSVIASGKSGAGGVVRGVLVADQNEAAAAKRQGKRAILLKQDVTLFGHWVTELDGIIATLGGDTTHFVMQGMSDVGLPFIYGATPEQRLARAREMGEEVRLDATNGRVFAASALLEPGATESVEPGPGPVPTFADEFTNLDCRTWTHDWAIPMDARSVELCDLDNSGQKDVIVTTEGKEVFGFSRSGDLKFQMNLPAKSTLAKAVSQLKNGRVSLILTCDDGHFYCVAPQNRRIEWSIPLHAAKTVCVARVAETDKPIALLGGGDESRRGRILEVDGEGIIVNEIEVPRPVPPQFSWVRAIDMHTADHQILVVCGGYDGRIHYFRNRKLLWSTALGDRNWVRTIRFAQGLTELSILVGLKDGSLACLDAAGKQRWTVRLDGWVNQIQVLPVAWSPGWQVLTFQSGGKVQLLDGNGNLISDLPSEEQLWDGCIERAPDGSGDLWLCGGQRFVHFHLAETPGLQASSTMPIRDSQAFDYDIAISFTGDDRTLAEALARQLRERGVRIFYDAFSEAELWGKDLYVYLDNTFRKQARFCVLVISRHYAKKAWCRHELGSIFARAFEENREYILPIRLDETQIPGIRPTVGYLSFPSKSVSEIVELIVQKLGSGRQGST
jgi:outer membrane protein assembly factor BamB